MSYIRSTHNPEALYIWSDDMKKTHVQMGAIQIGTLPTSAMDGLIERYVINHCPDNCRYADARIDEIWADGCPKVQFSYKDEWSCVMWGVTWDYIALSNYPRIKRQKDFFKIRNHNKY